MTTRDDVIRVNAEHPDWTAKQIADHLGIERYHVYNNARAAGLTLVTALRTNPVSATLPAIAAPAAQPPTDFMVYANTPADMAAAQAAMVEWCAAKIEAESLELAEALRNLERTPPEWSGPWAGQADRIRKRIEFYEKVLGALEHGYYIVPPFPIDIFAIRTTRKTPDRKTSTWRSHQHLQEAKMLPAGEGRYVSDAPVVYQRDVDGPMKEGKPTTVTEYFAKEFREVDFPFKLARAEVMQATQAAMALKIFDRMGSLPGGRQPPDPIICGQILMPHRGRAPLTFFVSWWLDTRTL